jgi:hypothetical protein
MAYNLVPTDLYDNIKRNEVTIVEDYIKTLEYNNKTLDFITTLFMYAVTMKVYDTAKMLACYGANTHGNWGDWALYYNMRRRVPFIGPVINDPREVCESCGKTTICKCGCNE